MNKIKPIGRPPKEGEKKQSYTVSILPSKVAKLIKKYGSLTKAIETVK